MTAKDKHDIALREHRLLRGILARGVGDTEREQIQRLLDVIFKEICESWDEMTASG